MTSVLKICSLTTVTLALVLPLVDTSIYNWTAEALQEQLEALTESRYLIFPHVYRAFIDAGRKPGHYNITSECQKGLIHYYEALHGNKGWAWRFYDATGKQGAGLFLGALTWKGNFQECLNTLGYTTGSGKNIGALFDKDVTQPDPQYCSVFLASPPWMYTIVDSLKLPFPVPMSPFIVDACVPSPCGENDVQNIVQQYVNEHSWGNMNFTVTDSRCYKGRDITQDAAALFSMTVLIVIACFVGLGTSYDIFLRRRKLRAKRGPDFLIGYQKDTKQYGILKVILAPPASNRGLKRRATVGGYEKSSQYVLSELKVNREKLLNKDTSSSLPDVLDDTSPSSPTTPNGPLTLDTVLPESPSPTAVDCEKNNSHTANWQKENLEKDNSQAAEFQKDSVQADETHTNESHKDDEKNEDRQKDELQERERQKNELEKVEEEKNVGEEEKHSGDTAKLLPDNHSGEQETEHVTGSAMRRASSDPGRLDSDVSELSDVFVETSSPGEIDVPPPPSRHKMSLKTDRQSFDAVMPGGPTSPLRFHHTPHVGRQPSMYEAQVAESPDLHRERRRRGSPSHVRHTPHMGRQGSVFERQISAGDNEDTRDPFEFLGDRHRLYDIPEEEGKLLTSENCRHASKLTPEVVIKPRPPVKELGLLSKMLLAFSFRKATKRIIAEGSADTLFCLNGVRVLSICWIVLGNVYLVIYLNPDVVDNHVDAVKLTQTFWVQAVINTTLAADSFFILSGALGAYNFMKLKKDCKKKKLTEVMTAKEYFMLIFHRLVRIGPCYLLVIMVFTNLMPYMGRGPRWSYEIQSVRTCKDHWWANALFFSNFYKADDMCMPHTYYLVNDFQFGLLMPFIMVPLLCFPKVGFVLLGLLVLTQIVSTIVLDEGINGNVLRMTKTDYFARIYVKPYCRVGVYAIGLGLGYLLWVTKRQVNFRKLPFTIFWLLSLVVICTLPYITYVENKVEGREWTGIETALYEALSRPLWGLALSWVIFACSTGQGAFINKLLSWNAFLPLCRITYGVYLLHPMLIAVVIGSRQAGFYLDFGELTYEFVADLVFSYFFAFVLITFVECPFTALEHSVRTHLGQRKKQH